MLLLFVATGCAGQQPVAAPESSTSEGRVVDHEWRWVGVRDVEVQVPADWSTGYDVVRADCIPRERPWGPWARHVPESPYVMVGSPNRGVPAIGCLMERREGDPGPEFGDLPFPLWQPFVQVRVARSDLDDPTRRDGAWGHQGWRLTRDTVDGVQVTVLAPPEEPGLGERVLGSARRVESTWAGCDPSSPVQQARFARPDGAPIPAAADVAAVAICEYARASEHSTGGLEGSRRVSGRQAQGLVAAIHRAPEGGGPDRPGNCSTDLHGERAIALRFFADAEVTSDPLAEAFVYYDWCFGNGIVDAAGTRALTRANCAPLFTEPPILIWSGQTSLVEVCGPLGER